MLWWLPGPCRMGRTQTFILPGRWPKDQIGGREVGRADSTAAGGPCSPLPTLPRGTQEARLEEAGRGEVRQLETGGGQYLLGWRTRLTGARVAAGHDRRAEQQGQCPAHAGAGGLRLAGVLSMMR